MKKIIVSKANGQWVAKFPGNKGVIDLFGTDTVPTGFPASTPAQDVMTAMKHANLDHVVVCL